MPRPPGLTASLLASGVALAWLFQAAAAALVPLAEGLRLVAPAAAALAAGVVAVTLAPWRGRRLLVRSEAALAVAAALLPLVVAGAYPLRLSWFQTVPPGAPASAALAWLLAAALLVPAFAGLGLRLPALAGCVAGRADAGEVITTWLAAHAFGVALGLATGPPLLAAVGLGFASLAAAALQAFASLTATRTATDPPPRPEPLPLGAPGALLIAVAAWAGLVAEPLRRSGNLEAIPALVALAASASLAARLAPTGSTWAASLVVRTAGVALVVGVLPHLPAPWASPLLGLGLGPLLAGLLDSLAGDERCLTRSLLLAAPAAMAAAIGGPGAALPRLGLAGVPAAAGLALGAGALYLSLRSPGVSTGRRLAAGLAATVSLLAATEPIRLPRGLPFYRLYTNQPDESLAVTRRGLVTTIHVDGVPWLRGPRAPAEAALGHLPWLLLGEQTEEPTALVLSLGTGAIAEACTLHGVKQVSAGVATPGRAAVTESLFGTRYAAAFDPTHTSIQVARPRTLLEAWPHPVTVVFAREAAGLRVTAEFAAAAARRVRAGGMLALALAPEQLHPNHLRGVIRALGRSFPHLELYGYPEPLLLASATPLPRRPIAIHQALQRPRVFSSLERAALPRHPTRVLARRLAGSAVLTAWAGPGPAPADSLPPASSGPPPTPESLLELYTTLATHPYASEVVTREDLMQKAGDGGVLLPTARVHLARDLAAITHEVLLRKAPLHPLEPRASPGALTGALTEWRGRIPEGSIWLRSWPGELLPDPHARHQSDVARLQGAARLSGHELRWAVYPLEDGVRYRALATWACAAQNRSHVLRVDFPAKAAGRRMVLETIEGVACLHPSGDGGLTWNHRVRRAVTPPG